MGVLSHMRSISILFLGLILAAPAAAQQSDAPADPPDARAQSQEADARSVDVDRLPLDLGRIQKHLSRYEERVERDGLNLRYQIQIYGAAPPLEFFAEDANLLNGPVPYGAPTHRELINHVTPQEFRAPIADFSALIRWLRDREKKK